MKVNVYHFAPQPNITAYELALILKVGILLMGKCTKEAIPEGCERHFKIEIVNYPFENRNF
jgi:stress-induced morphogen